MPFVWFSVVSYGLTQILVYGKIFDKIRPKKGMLADLASCPMCVGFWVGLFLWSLNDYTTLFSFDDSLVTGIFLGFASSAASYVLNVLFCDHGLKIEKFVHIKKGVLHESNVND